VTAWDVVERSDPAQISDERSALESWLEFHRSTLLLKCAGLEPEQLALRSCPPSILSLLGLVRHMTQVEAWFHDFDREPAGVRYWTDEDPEGDFDGVDPSRAEADLIAYRASVERARAAVTGLDLDEISPELDDGPYSLRWIYLHMIEEYARHNGHADMLRERIDGATGV
jgi:hypothetical protein